MSAVDPNAPRGYQRSFHGTIVPRVWINGFFWDRVDVSRNRLVLRPWLRRRRVIERDAVDEIGFERVMLPLLWRSIVRFLHDGNDVVPLLFTPFLKRRFRRALEDLEWPVVDRGRMPLRSVLRGR